jgi:predicted RNase H-like nuclease
MITTVVQFHMATPISLDDAKQRFESSAPKYQKLPGLIRKYYIRSEDGTTAGGIYLWENRAAAEKAYAGEWRERVAKLYGAEPVITWFDSPVIVDNAAGGTITTSAALTSTSGASAS